MQVEIIKENRLYLCSFRKEDAMFAISIWNDKEMGKCLLDEAMTEIDKVYLKEIGKLLEDEKCNYMIVEYKDSHEKVGICSFIPDEDGSNL